MSLTIHYGATKKTLTFKDERGASQSWDLTNLDRDQEDGVSEQVLSYLTAKGLFKKG